MTEARPTQRSPTGRSCSRRASSCSGWSSGRLVTLLIAVLITVLIAIPLSAFATRLERRGVPRAFGALIGIIGAVGVVAGLLALLIPPFVNEVEEFVDDVPGIIDDLGDDLHDLTGADSGEIGDEVQDFLQGFVDDPEKLIGPITSIGLGLAGVLGALLLMLVTAFFMAANPRPLVDAALSLVPPAHRGRARARSVSACGRPGSAGCRASSST